MAALASLGYAVSRWESRVHSGVLPRYAFGSLVALATFMLLRLIVR